MNPTMTSPFVLPFALKTQKLIALSLIPLLLFCLSCNNNSGLIVALNVLESAATDAVPVIQSFSAQLGPAATAQYIALAQASSQAANSCASELETTASSSQQILTCTTDFSPVATQVASIVVPAGAGEVSIIIGAVIAALQIVLSILGINKTSPNPTPAVSTKLTAYKAKAVGLNTDAARIRDIHLKAKALQPAKK